MDPISKQELEERKQFYKTLLVPTMPIEQKMDELWELPNEDLAVLLEQFEADEDHDICHAIKKVIEQKESNNPDCYQFLGLE